MFVSSYHIHNVLNFYSKQLSQDRSSDKQVGENKKPLADQINLSTEGKRRATIERVAQDILNKISDYGAKNKTGEKDHLRPDEDLKQHVASDNQKETKFVFNVINDLNKKTTNTLSVEDTNFLVNRLEQLARETAGENAGS